MDEETPPKDAARVLCLWWSNLASGSPPKGLEDACGGFERPLNMRERERERERLGKPGERSPPGRSSDNQGQRDAPRSFAEQRRCPFRSSWCAKRPVAALKVINMLEWVDRFVERV